METVKLYYENAFLQDFTAVVESCGAVKGGFAVVLDRTAFYPEGAAARRPRHAGGCPRAGRP